MHAKDDLYFLLLFMGKRTERQDNTQVERSLWDGSPQPLQRFHNVISICDFVWAELFERLHARRVAQEKLANVQRFYVFHSDEIFFSPAGMHAWKLSIRPYLLFIMVFVSFGTCSKLKVRVRLSDGLIAEEILGADSENDVITVEFKQRDGTHITVTFDFKRVSCLTFSKYAPVG